MRSAGVVPLVLQNWNLQREVLWNLEGPQTTELTQTSCKVLMQGHEKLSMGRTWDVYKKPNQQAFIKLQTAPYDKNEMQIM